MTLPLTNLDPSPEDPAPLELIEIGIQKRAPFSTLLDLAFQPSETGSGPGGNTHFLDDFPIWDPYYSPPQTLRLGFLYEDRLIACAAGRIAQTGTHALGMIGAVATHPDFRKRGLAGLLIRNLQESLQKLGSQGNLLFSGSPEFYKSFGFLPQGTQLICPLSLIEETALTELDRAQIHRGWCDGLFDLMVQRNALNKGRSIQLAADDIRWMRRHKNVSFLYYGKAFQPEAFIAFNRGLDLKGFVHEWAGHPALVLKLIAFAKNQGPRPPEWILGATEALGEFGLDPAKGLTSPLCLYQKPQNESFSVSPESPIWIWGLDGV